MRRAFGILIVASLALLLPVIAQIGGRPMVLLVARVAGPVTDPESPPPPPFMRDGARLAATPNGAVNAEMALRGLNMFEGPALRVTHAAVYFRFRVVPPPNPNNPPPGAMIQIMADGTDANIQNQQFMNVGYLRGGGKGAILIFRTRALRYDNNNPPNQVEQQGAVMLLIEDHAPGASQRPDLGAQPDRVTLVYSEGAYTYNYTGVIRQGDIYIHGRVIPETF